MSSTSFSTSCKAHGVITWTIEEVRSVVTNAKTSDELESEFVPFKDVGSGASTLRWSIAAHPNSGYKDKKGGNQKYVGVFMCLTSEDDQLTQAVKADYVLKVYLPEKKSWETIIDSVPRNFKQSAQLWGKRNSFSHAQLTKKSSPYLSKNGALLLRGEVDFEIPSSPVSKYSARFCLRQAELLRSEDSADVELVASDGRTSNVHSAILAAHSPVFRLLLKQPKVEGQPRQLTIDNIDGGALEVFLSFIYSGEISKVKEVAEQVLEAADRYSVGELRDVAAKHLLENLTLENAYRVSIAGEDRRLPALRKAASAFIVKNWEEFRQTNNFVQFKESRSAMFDVLEAACSKKRDADCM